MTTVLATVFVASLLGSLHCAGMCGGLVAFYAGTDASAGPRRMLSHAAYNGGRLAGYVLLGLAAGAIGAALNVAGALAGIQRVALTAAGVVMIAWGLIALLQIRGYRIFRHNPDSRLQRAVRRSFAIASRKPPVVRAGTVGLLSALLPCGWLWAFVVTAAGTGSAANGALVMAVFWAGTVPILLAIGLGAQLIANPVRRFAPSLTAILLVVLGLLAIVGRPPTAAAAMAKHQAKTAKESADNARNMDHATLPCCGGEEHN